MTERIIIGDNKILLGKQGENGSVVIKFPKAPWISEHGESGFFTLLNKRPGEDSSYEHTVTVDDQYVNWVVNNIDTAYVGNGKCELLYFKVENNETVVAKSQVYDTYVTSALGMDDGVPEQLNPYETWRESLLSDITEQADRAVQARSGAEAARDEASRIVDNPAVLYEEQALEPLQKATALNNLGAVNGVFPMSMGGLGATSAAGARANLGAAAADGLGNALGIACTLVSPTSNNIRSGRISFIGDKNGYCEMGKLVYVRFHVKVLKDVGYNSPVIIVKVPKPVDSTPLNICMTNSSTADRYTKSCVSCRIDRSDGEEQGQISVNCNEPSTYTQIKKDDVYIISGFYIKA